MSSAMRKTPGGKGDNPRGNQSEYREGYDKIDWKDDLCPECKTKMITLPSGRFLCPNCVSD